MKSIIAAIITCLLLFGVSAGASVYLSQAEPETEDASTEEPLDEDSDEIDVKEMATQMPIAARPNQALTIEAVLQMSESAKRRQQRLDELETQLKKDDQRIKMLFRDLDREKQELTTISNGVESKVAALDEMNQRLEVVLEKIEQENLKLTKLEKKTGASSKMSNEIQSRVSQVKGWFSGLEAKQAADILIEKANAGDMEFAAALLHSLPDRQKAKILPAINDPTLVTQLIDSLQLKPAKEK